MKGPEDWCDMLRFSGSCQNPGSSVLDELQLSNAEYTPQDNWADFGPISPLPTILGNVPVILVVLNMILSDFPVV